MRNVILMMSVSLDGFVARPDGDLSWVFPGVDPEAMKWTVDLLKQTDTQLMGRVAYEEQAPYWPTATDELAPIINGSTKIVFSDTLTSVDWQNSRLATADVADEIEALKKQSGKHIFVPGGASFARSLSGRGLIDEYHLRVHPVVLGTGLPLFTDEIELTLLDMTRFSSGTVALVYRPT